MEGRCFDRFHDEFLLLLCILFSVEESLSHVLHALGHRGDAPTQCLCSGDRCSLLLHDDLIRAHVINTVGKTQGRDSVGD